MSLLIKDVTNSSEEKVLRARVMTKTELNEVGKTNPKVKVFSLSLVDGTGKIRATAFGSEATRLFGDVQAGRIYEIRHFGVKAANSSYTTATHAYEIDCLAKTEFKAMLEPLPGFPLCIFSFTSISGLHEMDKGMLIDTIGVCVHVGEMEQTRGSAKKRNVELLDAHYVKIAVAFLGTLAEGFQASYKHHIVALEGARVSDFGGKSLSVGWFGSYMIDPDIPETRDLQGWYGNRDLDRECKPVAADVTEGNAQLAQAFRIIKRKLYENDRNNEEIQAQFKIIQGLTATPSSSMESLDPQINNAIASNADGTKRAKQYS